MLKIADFIKGILCCTLIDKYTRFINKRAIAGFPQGPVWSVGGLSPWLPLFLQCAPLIVKTDT